MTLNANFVHLFDARGLPYLGLPVPAPLDFSTGQPLGHGDVSALFEGAPDITISDTETGLSCQISTDGCVATQIWAPKNQPFFCAEPLSHFVDDFSVDTLARNHYLEPGKTKTASMSIRPFA
jgi:galactose mutarotase-like enzyme